MATNFYCVATKAPMVESLNIKVIFLDLITTL